MQQSKELERNKEKLHAYDTELSEMSAKIDDIVKRQGEAEVDLKRHEHTLQRLTKEKKETAKLVTDLNTQHPWIATEKQYVPRSKLFFIMFPSVRDHLH
jgi:hypothetical protein